MKPLFSEGGMFFLGGGWLVEHRHIGWLVEMDEQTKMEHPQCHVKQVCSFIQ